MRKISKTGFLYLLILLTALFFLSDRLEAAGEKSITMSRAVNLAVGKSRDYKSTRSKIFLKQAEYENAVKAIALKKKNMSTFRWTPLLSFKFPEKPALADEFEYTYKPLQINSEISALRHKLDDIRYSVAEEVSNLYVNLYTAQEIIEYKKSQLTSMEETLKKNQARLAVGIADGADIETAKASIEGLKAELALKEREFQIDREKLSQLIGVDVTVGYCFENPYKEASVEREQLSYIEEETLKKSQEYYEAKLDRQLALTALDTNYNLMRNQYGSSMDYISSFVAMAKNGEEVDSAEFKLYYNRFLTAIDSPWTGTKKILFIKIPKEWFKGAIDGVRYVEDEPYALYNSVLEYQEAEDERQQREKDIRKQVQSIFENMVTAKNSYETVEKQTEAADRELERARIQNKAGELAYLDYEEIRKNYEELELEKLEALKTYTQILYSFDRLSCGTITKLLAEKETGFVVGEGGESFLAEEETAAYYYINTIVEDNAFEIGISVPEEGQVSVDEFELWVNNVMLGDRTGLDSTLRHLTLAVDSGDNVFLRLYEDGQFVADASVDTSAYRGELPITVEKKEQNNTKTIGSYSYKKNKNTKAISVKLKVDESESIAYFRLLKDGNYILYSEPAAVDEEITYLSLLEEELNDLTVEFYDSNKVKVGEGFLNPDNMSIEKLN